MDVCSYRELYEGLTQKDDGFRTAIRALTDDMPEILLTDLERTQNRLNHAMLGVHPIYRREVELSGIVNYADRSLSLYTAEGGITHSFHDLDPSYVEFLESLKRVYNVKELLPLSSVALKTSNQWLSDDNVKVPDLSDCDMNLPPDDIPLSRSVLKTAFARSMVMMNHLHEEIERHGLDKTYEVNRSDLITYCQTKQFDFQFDRSVNELSTIAEESAGLVSGLDNR